MKRGEAAHRKANDVRALEAQMIEHRSDVGGGAPLGIGDLACRHLRRRITSGVECDAAVAPAEMSHLRLPAAMIPGEFVHEDQRSAGTGLLIVKGIPSSVMASGMAESPRSLGPANRAVPSSPILPQWFE